MPIRINLLAEAQAAEELRRRDPVKRGCWLAAIVISLAVFWSLTLQTKIFIAKARLSATESKWGALEPRYLQVMDNRSKIKQAELKLSALHQLSTNRFLWASFLNNLQQCALDDIQLFRLKSEQNYVSSDNTNNATHTNVPTATERITVIFEAHDYSPNTIGHARLKESLANTALFQNSKTNLLLMALAAPGPDPKSPSGLAANFTMRCAFPDKERLLK